MSTAEREALRETVRRFMAAEVLPQLAEWERVGELPRELHKKAGVLGLLGVGFPSSVGGDGELADVVAVVEEMHYSGGSG
ncbi:MAG: acyl-CoA dehydrogenase family protein, partial [Nocardioidaceae bacterium]